MEKMEKSIRKRVDERHTHGMQTKKTPFLQKSNRAGLATHIPKILSLLYLKRKTSQRLLPGRVVLSRRDPCNLGNGALGGISGRSPARELDPAVTGARLLTLWLLRLLRLTERRSTYPSPQGIGPARSGDSLSERTPLRASRNCFSTILASSSSDGQ